MDENTTILFDIFFNRVIITFKELFNGQLNNTMIDKFNTSCKDDLECQDVALFCNLTSSLCQCATFYLRNENAGICEFQQTNLTSWLKTNGTTETWKTNFFIITPYKLPLSAICVMILSAICIFLCGIFICFGDEHKDNGLEVVSKEQKESHKIEMPQ